MHSIFEKYLVAFDRSECEVKLVKVVHTCSCSNTRGIVLAGRVAVRPFGQLTDSFRRKREIWLSVYCSRMQLCVIELCRIGCYGGEREGENIVKHAQTSSSSSNCDIMVCTF